MDAVPIEADTGHCGESFTHALLRLMPFPSRAPFELLHLQEHVVKAQSQDLPHQERVAAVVGIAALLQQRGSSWIPDAKAILLEILERFGRDLQSPQLMEMLALECLRGEGMKVLEPSGSELGRSGVPWIVQSDPTQWGTRLATGKPSLSAFRAWAYAVHLLRRLRASALEDLATDELQAGIRCLQLYSLYLRTDFDNDRARQRLAMFRGVGVGLWHQLLAPLRSRVEEDDEFDCRYGETAIRQTLRHLRGEEVVEELDRSLDTASTPPSPVTQGPHLVIIDGEIPAGDVDDRTALSRYAVLKEPLPVATLPELAALETLLGRLHGEFPWAEDAISSLGDDLLSRRAFGALELGGMPTLLVGPPGCGKSRLVRRLAEELAVPFLPLAMAGMNDSMALLGTARGWSTGQPSPLVSLLARRRSASAFVLLDEIDKVGQSSAHSVPPTVALLNLLEPEGARQWYDTYLQATCNLTKLLFWATANGLESLQRPLLSRFRIVYVPPPRAEHFDAIARAAVDDFEHSWGLPSGALPKVSLSASPMKPRSAREVRQAVHWLLCDWHRASGRATQRH